MRAAAGLPVLAVAGVLLTVCLFFGEGSGDGRLFWIGACAVLAALTCVIASFAGVLPRPSPTLAGWVALALVTAFVLWQGATIGWSIAPDRSWAYLNRGLVYLALAVLGLYVGSLVRRPAATTGGLLAALAFGALGWALLGKVFPGLFPDGARVARLRNPVGYWNALALVAALALPLALWLASGLRHWRAVRAGGVLLVYVALVALVLTYSRAGIVVAAAGVCLWLILCSDRFEGLVMLVAGGAPAAAVALWASTQDGLVEDLQSPAARERAGTWFGLALAAGAAVALGLSHYGSRRGAGLSPAARQTWAKRLALGMVAAVVVGVVAVTVAAGGPGKWLDEFRGQGEVVQGSGRLGDVSTNNRWKWWQEGWELFVAEPLGGKGAHTFEIARRPLREGSVVAVEPHNIGVQALAETGILGLLFGVGAVAFALLALVEVRRRLEGDERAAAAALAVTLPVYAVHVLADIDWDFVAVSGPVFLVCGTLFAAGRAPKPGRSRPAAAVLAGLVGFGVLYSLTAPWLAARRVDAAYDAIARGDALAAVSAARQAHDLNPLSVEPLSAWALGEAVGRDVPGALARYRQATRLQPENSDTWYALGAFEFGREKYGAAFRHLEWAWGLDRYGPAGLPGGLLDQAREKANAGHG